MKKQNSINATATANVNNAPVQVRKNTRNATQVAADAGAKAQAQAEKAAEKEQKKSALQYGMYGLLTDARNTPTQACKRFYVTACAICDGAFAQVLAEVLGKNKNDFCNEYRERVKRAYEEKNRKNYTDFLVWQVVWQDLKLYTLANVASADKRVAQAVQALADAMEARKQERDAQKASAEKAAK